MGNAVSISSDGTKLAIASYNASTADYGDEGGIVNTYQYIPGTKKWEIYGQTLVGLENTHFGSSMSLSAKGDLLAVSQPSFNFGALSNCGQVKIYRLSGNKWSKLGDNIVGQIGNQRLGTHVVLSGDGSRLFISGNFGHVKVFDITGNIYTENQYSITGSNPITSIASSYDGTYVALGRLNSVTLYEKIAVVD